MKKLTTLLVMLLFTAGMAIGQNNVSQIDQIGDDIYADVDQVGDNNLSVLNQSDDFITGHYAEIEQIGDNNISRINTQNGGGSASVTMTGSDNKLGGFSPGGSAGYPIQTGAAANQKNSLNEFTLDITGSFNNIGMDQEFGIGEVSISGSDNDVALRQKADANYQLVDFHRAFINVDGSDNLIVVDQGPAGGFGAAFIGNRAEIDLLNSSDNNVVRVNQHSDNNYSKTTVDGMSNQAYVSQQ